MDENEDLVTLEGLRYTKVRRRWHADLLVLRTKDGPMMPGAEANGDIELVGTEPRLTNLHIEGFHPGSFGPEDLAAVDWQAVMAIAVQIEATNQLSRTTSPDQQQAWRETYEQAGPQERAQWHRRNANPIKKAVSASRRKNGVTKERLVEVARLFDEGGVEAVMDEFGKSRSYSYQLLARAREELQ